MPRSRTRRATGSRTTGVRSRRRARWSSQNQASCSDRANRRSVRTPRTWSTPRKRRPRTSSLTCKPRAETRIKYRLVRGVRSQSAG
eukprot:759825-Hanusia_phi.AAC.13